MRSPRFQHNNNGRLSRSRQRQYIALHSLAILPEHVKDWYEQVPDKTRKALGRIEHRRLELLAGLGQVSEKQSRQVMRRFVRAMKGFDPDDQISPEDHLNACLWMIETLRDQQAKPRKEWALLAGSLSTLYAHLDADLSNQQSMDQGELLGRAIFKEFR